jgi:hypothetical protein
VTVAGGAHVNRGRRIGSVGAAAGHTGLHVGVRRASRRFGYVDPWPLLRRSPVADSPRVIPAPRRVPLRPAHSRPLRPRAVRPRPIRPAVPESPRLAPPVAWVGLALLLAGAARAGRLPRARPTRGHASRSAGAAARMGSAPPGRAGPPPRPAPRSASGRL